MGTQSKKVDTYEEIKGWLNNESMRKAIKQALPKSAPLEPWIQAALVNIRTSKKILNCTPISIMGALMTVASLGLRLEGALGQAHLEAYPVKKQEQGKWITSHYEAQAQVGYQGLLALVYQDKEIQDIECQIVYRGDTFDHAKGSNPFLTHTWDHSKPKAERGEMSAIYTGLRYKGGYYSFEVYPIEDILDHRRLVLREKGIRVEESSDGEDVFVKIEDNKVINIDYTRQPWIKYPVPMFKKTAVRWSAKYWKLAPELDTAVSLISLDDAGINQNLAEAARFLPPEVLAKIRQADPRTAEKVPTSPAQATSLARSEELKNLMFQEARARNGGAKQPEPGNGKESQPAAEEGAEAASGEKPNPPEKKPTTKAKKSTRKAQGGGKSEQPALYGLEGEKNSPENTQGPPDEEEQSAIEAREREEWEAAQAARAASRNNKR